MSPKTEPLLSVLMTFYAGNTPEQISQSLSSIGAQTRLPEQVVAVSDGTLPAELADQLDRELRTLEDAGIEVTKVELPENKGAGPASDAGLKKATGTWIARLDADDIARPERCSTQLDYLEQHSDVDVLGTALAEFAGANPQDIGQIRTLPETHEEIARYARLNSPVNNPSVMIRRSALEDIGGYQDVHFIEDYDLYVRLLQADYTFHNLPDALTLFRTTPDVHSRRTHGLTRAEWDFQKRLVDYGFITRPRALMNFCVRSAYRMIPAGMIARVNRRLFSK